MTTNKECQQLNPNKPYFDWINNTCREPLSHIECQEIDLYQPYLNSDTHKCQQPLSHTQCKDLNTQLPFYDNSIEIGDSIYIKCRQIAGSQDCKELYPDQPFYDSVSVSLCRPAQNVGECRVAYLDKIIFDGQRGCYAPSSNFECSLADVNTPIFDSQVDTPVKCRAIKNHADCLSLNANIGFFENGKCRKPQSHSECKSLFQDKIYFDRAGRCRLPQLSSECNELFLGQIFYQGSCVEISSHTHCASEYQDKPFFETDVGCRRLLSHSDCTAIDPQNPFLDFKSNLCRKILNSADCAAFNSKFPVFENGECVASLLLWIILGVLLFLIILAAAGLTIFFIVKRRKGEARRQEMLNRERQIVSLARKPLGQLAQEQKLHRFRNDIMEDRMDPDESTTFFRDEDGFLVRSERQPSVYDQPSTNEGPERCDAPMIVKRQRKPGGQDPADSLRPAVI